jgi:hypothetical protein
MDAPHVALIGFTAGASLAAGIMAVIAIRTAVTITRAHRWYQIKQL